MSLPVVLESGSSWGTRFSAYRSALAAAQKPGAGVPAYMRWVNRGAARVVAAACAAFGWTPNFVSFISVCFSTLGLIVLVALEPAWWTGLIVGTALAVGFMFDSADGQVSRVTGASSKTGEWVDHVADAFRSPAIHFCTAAAVMIYRPESWWLAVVALVYGWVTSGQFMSQILAEQFVRRRAAGTCVPSCCCPPTRACCAGPSCCGASVCLSWCSTPSSQLSRSRIPRFRCAVVSATCAPWTRPLNRPPRRPPRRGSPVPELSVLLPARNAAGTITRAVASTLAAMPRDAELVVGNDSSSDSTVGEAIRGASRGGVVDPRLRIEDITPGEGGVSRVLTQLMERTDSRLVGRMDADDVSLKGRFKRTMRAIERGDDMVFTQMIELRGSRPVPRMPYEITPEDMGWHLLLTNPVCHPTMLATREIMDRVGGYRSVPAEDYDLWMRVASAGGRIRRIAPWGLLYRIHPGQVTGNASWRSDSWKNPEQAQAFADLSVSLTGQELSRLVSLVSLPRDEAERELDRFVQVYTQGVASRPATSRRALERRLNARAAWVRSHLQGEQS